jgi:1-acyl-sn-glycerol-3-phosphate acyltransferase
MTHTVIIYVWIILGTFLFATLAILTSFIDRSGNKVHLVGRLWAKSILWVSGVKVDVRGLSHIDNEKSYIFMANHQSNFDIPVLLGCFLVQFRWLAKAELFKIPIFGRSMRGAGYISIDRSNRESAFRSLKKAAETIRNGVSVLIFPEGTRSDDGKIKPFKKGGFVLALDAGVPIVPIAITGTRSIMPKFQLMVRPGSVVIHILPPVETTIFTRKTKNKLVGTIREMMIESFDTASRGERAC